MRRTFGFVASEWRPPQEPNHFYGTGETFVWQLERLANLPPLLDGSGEPPPDEVLHTYRWSGRNSHFCFSAREHLAVGSGGHFALWLDAELLHGSSGTSETFSNPSLCTADGGRRRTRRSRRWASFAARTSRCGGSTSA